MGTHDLFALAVSQQDKLDRELAERMAQQFTKAELERLVVYAAAVNAGFYTDKLPVQP